MRNHLQDGIRPTEIEAFAVQQFQQLDLDNTGRIDFDQFVNFYQNISTTKARRELRSALGPQAESEWFPSLPCNPLYIC